MRSSGFPTATNHGIEDTTRYRERINSINNKKSTNENETYWKNGSKKVSNSKQEGGRGGG